MIVARADHGQFGDRDRHAFGSRKRRPIDEGRLPLGSTVCALGCCSHCRRAIEQVAFGDRASLRALGKRIEDCASDKGGVCEQVIEPVAGGIRGPDPRDSRHTRRGDSDLDTFPDG